MSKRAVNTISPAPSIECDCWYRVHAVDWIFVSICI